MKALILVSILFATATAQQPDSVPQFSLPQLEGRTLRSDDLKDKIIVLEDTTGAGRADKATVFAQFLSSKMLSKKSFR